MTRPSLSPLVLALLAAAPAAAEEFHSDAFGILPETALTPDRAGWSGLVSSTASGPRQIAPGPPETLLLFVGPKSLVAGGEPGHAATLILDALGNLGGEGAAVYFTLGAAQETDPAAIYGLAERLFVPPPVAGDFRAAAALGPVQSAPAGYRVTADLASVAPALSALPDAPLAETFVDVSGPPLTDRFGNVAEPGTALTVLLTHDDGAVTLLPAKVKDGSAETRLLTRDLPGGGTLTATIGRAVSPGVALPVTPLLPAGPVPVQLWALPETPGAMGLSLGPVTTDAGHLLNDGAAVAVSVTGRSGAMARAEGWVLDGRFLALLALDPGDAPFEVSVETPLRREVRQVHPGPAPEAPPPEAAE